MGHLGLLEEHGDHGFKKKKKKSGQVAGHLLGNNTIG